MIVQHAPRKKQMKIIQTAILVMKIINRIYIQVIAIKNADMEIIQIMRVKLNAIALMKNV